MSRLKSIIEVGPKMWTAAAARVEAACQGFETGGGKLSNMFPRPISTERDALSYWMLRGLEQELAIVTEQLVLAKEGLIRWQAMDRALRDKPGGTVYPYEYCPELSPDDVAILKADENEFDPRLFPLDMILPKLIDKMYTCEAGFFTAHTADCVQEMVLFMTARVGQLSNLQNSLWHATMELLLPTGP